MESESTIIISPEIEIDEAESNEIDRFESILDLWIEEVLEAEHKISMESVEKSDMQDQQVRDDNEYIKKRFIEKNQDLIQDLLKSFESFQQEFEKLKEKDSLPKKLVFLGNTGAGKSTLIHYLKRDKLIFDSDKNSIILAQGNSVAIGNNKFESTTTSCEFYQYEDIIYIDCPGFNDSRGLTQEIKNAYHLKALSGLSEVRLVLVVDISEIKAMKGKPFKELLQILSTMFDFGTVNSSISLIITKGQENIAGYISDLEDFHRRNRTQDFATLFASEQMRNRIALFPMVTRAGEVPPQWARTIASAINASIPTQINFRLGVSPGAKNSIQKLVNLLKSYSLWLLTKMIEAKNNNIKKNIAENKYFSGSRIKDHLRNEFNISTHSLDDFIRGLRIFTKDDDKDCDNLKTIGSCLKFLSELNEDAEFNLVEWDYPFLKFRSIYAEFAKPLEHQFEDNNSLLRVQAPIITTSELSKLSKTLNIKAIRSIYLVSYLFIIDEDLELPGIDLYLSTYYCQAHENKTISLKGRDGTPKDKDGGNGGSFYGFAKAFNENRIIINTSGGCGYDGSYKVDEYLQRKFEEDQLAIQSIENKLTPLKNIQEKKKQLEQEKDFMLENNPNQQRTLRDIINQKRVYENDLKAFEKKKHEISEKNKQIEVPKFKEHEREFWDQVEKFNVLDDFSLYEERVNNVFKEFKVKLESLLIPSDISQEETEFKLKFEQQYQINVDGDYRLISICDLHTLDETIKEVEKDLEQQKDKAKKNKDSLEEMKDNFRDFEEKVKDIRNDKERLKKIRESLSEQEKIQILDTDRLRNTFHQYYHEITEILRKCKEAEKEYEKFVVQKDSTIWGSREPFQKKIGGKLLTFKPDKDQFLKSCQADKCKIEKLIEETQSSANAKKLSLEEKDKMLALLKDFQRYKLQKEVLKLKTDWKLDSFLQSVGTEKIIKLLGDYISEFVRQLEKKDAGLLKGFKGKMKALLARKDPEEAFKLLKIIYETNLNRDFLISKIEKLQIRLEYARDYIKELSKVITNSEMIQSELDLKRRDYEKWKKDFNQTILKRPDIMKLIEDFNLIIYPDNDRNCDLLAYSEDLLRQEVNLVTRVERTWDDRDSSEKSLYILKELLCFNRQYKERYQLKGEQGGKGGNCGVIELNTKSVKPVSHIGKGGQSSYSFEGVYLNEKSFVGLRNILGVSEVKELNEEEAAGNGDRYVKSITSGALATGAAALAKNATETAVQGVVGAAVANGARIGFMAGAGFGLIGLQFLLSPLLAIGSSQWIEGPFKIKQENGRDGKRIEKKCVEKEFSNLSEYMEKIRTFMDVIYSENSVLE